MYATIKPKVPTRVAYTWFIAFAVVFTIPFVWYVLNNVLSTLSTAITANFESSFNSTQRAAANVLFSNFWSYMPIVVLIPVFVWAVMETLKERKREYGY